MLFRSILLPPLHSDQDASGPERSPNSQSWSEALLGLPQGHVPPRVALRDYFYAALPGACLALDHQLRERWAVCSLRCRPQGLVSAGGIGGAQEIVASWTDAPPSASGLGTSGEGPRRPWLGCARGGRRQPAERGPRVTGASRLQARPPAQAELAVPAAPVSWANWGGGGGAREGRAVFWAQTRSPQGSLLTVERQTAMQGDGTRVHVLQVCVSGPPGLVTELYMRICALCECRHVPVWCLCMCVWPCVCEIGRASCRERVSSPV